MVFRMDKKMNTKFPDLLEEHNNIEIDYEADGIDFEPYDKFNSEEDTSGWIKAWTGNNQLDGKEYKIFGQDGTGGYAAFWCIRDIEDLLQQPIVFFGSEGELGVIASNFYDYVWLFANGIGPYEAVAYPEIENKINSNFLKFANDYAKTYEAKTSEIIARAQKEFPNFVSSIQQLCGY
jgi:hypothetical protein